MGNDTSSRVNTSDVGVMIAAMARILTMAWRRYRRMKVAEIKLNLASNQHRMGISKTMPIIKFIIISVSMYDCREIMFSTSSLTW